MKAVKIIWALPALGGMLAAGCAALEPEPAPPPGQAVLEAKLAALDTRLAALEGQVVEQRREQGRALDQSLAEVGREIQGTRKSVAELRRKVEMPVMAATRPERVAGDGLESVPAGRCGLGTLSRGGSGSQTGRVHPIPTAVPDSAREILVYAQVATGYVEGGAHRFRVAAALDGGREVSFYLYATGQSQGGLGLQIQTTFGCRCRRTGN